MAQVAAVQRLAKQADGRNRSLGGADAKIGAMWRLGDKAAASLQPHELLRGDSRPAVAAGLSRTRGGRIVGGDMGAIESIRAKRDDIERVAAAHGARNIRIFGSVARGEAGPQSDVDFLIDTCPPTSPWFPAGLILDLEDLLGRKVDVVSEKALHPYLRDRILREAIRL